MDNRPHWLEPSSPQLESPPLSPRTGNGQQILTTPLHDQILAAKNEIDRIAPAGQWDDAKKITNSYEYIFLSLQRRMHRSISDTLPLSRSYFKMLEIWNQLGLNATDVKQTAHSAEGPGGFLEAIQFRTGHKTPMVAMTLRSTERTVPGWRKSAAFLNKHSDVKITYGADNTGNLYSLANQDAFAAIAGQENDIYTADGGFDFSADFNGQENTVQRLLIAEVLAGLTTLKSAKGSTMILKIFDTTHRATLEILWLLNTLFDRTALIKPHTSRPANSERYWIGRDYRGSPDWVIALLRQLTATDAPMGWDQIFAEPPWTPSWLAGLIDFQAELERVQLTKIQLTLNIIKSTTREEIRDLLVTNIRNSRTWCAENGVATNPAYTGLSDEQAASLNLEEALVPFQASVARTNLQALSRHVPMPRVSTSAQPPRPPAAPAWRSAIPASVLGRTPSNTTGAAPSSGPPAPHPSAPASDPAPAPP